MNSFPESVSLARPSVPLESGIAQVTLSAEALLVESTTLDRMQTQLDGEPGDRRGVGCPDVGRLDPADGRTGLDAFDAGHGSARSCRPRTASGSLRVTS